MPKMPKEAVRSESTSIDLISMKAVEAASSKHIAGKRIQLVVERRHLPKAYELFDLATDAAMGAGTREFLPMRISSARMMAGQSAASLFGILKLENPKAAIDTMNHFEKGRREPSDFHLKELSKTFKVPRRWLARGGEEDPPGGAIPGDELFPDWLSPWWGAVIYAKFIVETERFRYLPRSEDFIYHDSTEIYWKFRRKYETEQDLDREIFRWSPETLIAAIEAVVRACNRALDRASIWTRLAFKAERKHD